MFAEDDEEDNESLPDMDDPADGDISADDADDAAIRHTQSADAAARNKLRGLLGTIKSASYDVPLAAVLAAIDDVQPINDKMVGLMAVDLDLVRPRGRSSQGKHHVWLVLVRRPDLLTAMHCLQVSQM
jgi:hypothetical protein